MNKGNFNSRYNRKVLSKKVDNTTDNIVTNCNNIDSITINNDNNNGYNSCTIRPDEVHTYRKPNRLHSIVPSEYTDTQRSVNYSVRGNFLYEIPKTVYRIPTIELKQFSLIVKIACKVLGSLNGYVSIKDVKNYLLENNINILCYSTLVDVVKAFLSTHTHLKKRYSYNRVKNNNVTVGYDTQPVKPKSWYEKEHWSKLMSICEL